MFYRERLNDVEIQGTLELSTDTFLKGSVNLKLF